MGIPPVHSTALWLYYTCSANSIRTCGVLMTWLIVWDCNLIILVCAIILNTLVQMT